MSASQHLWALLAWDFVKLQTTEMNCGSRENKEAILIKETGQHALRQAHEGHQSLSVHSKLLPTAALLGKKIQRKQILVFVWDCIMHSLDFINAEHYKFMQSNHYKQGI